MLKIKTAKEIRNNEMALFQEKKFSDKKEMFNYVNKMMKKIMMTQYDEILKVIYGHVLYLKKSNNDISSVVNFIKVARENICLK